VLEDCLNTFITILNQSVLQFRVIKDDELLMLLLLSVLDIVHEINENFDRLLVLLD